MTPHRPSKSLQYYLGISGLFGWPILHLHHGDHSPAIHSHGAGLDEPWFCDSGTKSQNLTHVVSGGLEVSSELLCCSLVIFLLLRQSLSLLAVEQLLTKYSLSAWAPHSKTGGTCCACTQAGMLIWLTRYLHCWPEKPNSNINFVVSHTFQGATFYSRLQFSHH